MPPLSLLIKPVSGSCNMRCRYCFYADEMVNREVALCGRMSQDTLETIVSKAAQTAEGRCTMGFQGGEPTLAGLGFFQNLVELQARYARPGLTFHNTLQTNGLLLDEAWAAFLAENNFLVGLSLDGRRGLHDANRVDAAQSGTFQRVMRAARLLREAGAPFNILTVVTAETAGQIEGTYRFFVDNGFAYQQYIPCLDPLGEARGGHDYSLRPDRYADFLKRLFDLWYQDTVAGKFVSIRYFENLADMLQGCPPESCGMLGQCTAQYVVEADGTVYPCDFYMLDEYRLGNLRTDSFPQLDAQRAQLRFIEQSQVPDEACGSCQWKCLCRGGCRRDRQTPQGLARNYYCAAYQSFFAHAAARLAQLTGAREVQACR